ncbi:unnamed protein product [Plutella xylostella]|uniref:(diamondback moth) hypothetical protein n=1 Tax=Plutella xylostella TaxID=51655 RepID=A0A8S4FZV3_PLUXY|nr:unnamed protein product [Plutella xylostella]
MGIGNRDEEGVGGRQLEISEEHAPRLMVPVPSESGNKEVRPRRAASGDWHRSTTARGRGRRRRGVAESGDGGASQRGGRQGDCSGVTTKRPRAQEVASLGNRPPMFRIHLEHKNILT